MEKAHDKREQWAEREPTEGTPTPDSGGLPGHEPLRLGGSAAAAVLLQLSAALRTATIYELGADDSAAAGGLTPAFVLGIWGEMVEYARLRAEGASLICELSPAAGALQLEAAQDAQDYYQTLQMGIRPGDIDRWNFKNDD